MHWQARLFYRALLQVAFSTSPNRPNLPDDDDKICKLLGNIPRETWLEHQAEVLEMFGHETVNNHPVLTQGRLQRDYDALQDYRYAQSKSSTEYWKKVRKDRQGSGVASHKGSQSLASPKPVIEDVDVDSDLESENDGERDVEIVPPVRSSSPPFNSNSTSNARNIVSPLAHCLAEIHEDVCKCPLPEEGWDRVSAIWNAGDYDVSKLLNLWRTFLAWDCLHPEAPLDQFADGLEEELKAAHPRVTRVWSGK